MNLNISIKLAYIFFFSILIIGCGEKKAKNTIENAKANKISVYNFDDEQQLNQYRKLKLDETHPNLLNPEISNSDYDDVKAAWVDLHQNIGDFMDENDFQWQTTDSTITVVHKFYFDSEGNIENYFFNVINESISFENKEQFSNLISNFAIINSISYQSDGKFAQCGKTRYLNY
ncbi:hypothetical protein [Nonlabens agnitus]|uniref:Uncharacterized protein n=1 Tax=Nonlabens agnitus TaxID=870484 RepID=A0A2S9WV69_9FLAO|nr:hypothetical protein [Nonlabens agnitus]PRP67368.1 hypothetical protein BST86_09815 [Nonlabens agnitus]